MPVAHLITIGELAERSGLAPSALRFYESRGLLSATRTDGGQRRYKRDTIRRVAFIAAAQQVGLSLGDIAAALSQLPDRRTPNQKDWGRIAGGWQSLLDERIHSLELLRDRLSSCIGCGCLSLETCALQNPDDQAAEHGTGPRYLLGDEPMTEPL